MRARRVFVNESFIGGCFIAGRAWLTGTTQYFLDPEDPFPAGFLL